ncbi:MAG: hypothetical protein WC506_01800 [Candidatus Micrarchaeia archaeon]
MGRTGQVFILFTISVLFGAIFAQSLPVTSGLILHFKADAIAQSNNTAVSTWVGSQGSLRNATQASSAQRPAYLTNIRNGLPAVLFDGTDDYMYINNYSTPIAFKNITYYAIYRTLNQTVRNVNGNGQFNRLVSITTLAGMDYQDIHFLIESDEINGGNWRMDQRVLTGNGSLSNGIFGQYVTSNTGEYGVDQSYPYRGYLAEFVVYNRTLNSSENSSVYNTLATKWGFLSQPATTGFGGSSTNFSNISNLADVRGLVLEATGKGKIAFPPTYSVNAAGQNYTGQILMGNGFISVNSSALHSSFNSTATLTMNLSGVYSGTAAPTIYYYEPFTSSLATILQNGTACAAPRCTGVAWNSSTRILTFNVTGFSDYGANGSANYSGAGGSPSNSTGTLGINITSTNQIAVYTSNGMNDSTFSFVPVTPPAAGSITLISNQTSNTTGGELGFLVENQGNVNVSITVASDKDAASFIGGSAPLFQMFGGVNETGACPSLNESMQSLSASDITICPSLAYADSQDTIWAYVLVKIDSDSPPQTSTATLTFTSTQV